MSSSPGSERLLQQQQIHKSHSKSPTGLTGMERPLLPSNPASKKSSQSPNHYKPLPPPPLSQGRRTSLSPPRHQSKPDKPRRSSSIYSRTASTWYTADDPPRAPSLSEHPLPKINSIYKDSRLASVATMSEPQLLLPRTYSPMPTTASKNISSSPSPERAFEQRPSVLLPIPMLHPQVPQKYLNTVSLEKARAVQNASDTEHLLPEELRARMIAKARSSEHIVKLTDQLNEKPQKPGSICKVHEPMTMRLPSMMMLDAETWHRFDPSQAKNNDAYAQTTFVNAAQVNTRWSGSTAIPMSRDQSLSQNSSIPASEVSVDEPERGRTLHRGSRQAVKLHIPRPPSDAAAIASEYTTLVSGPWDGASQTRYNEAETNVELTPQPLFAFKSPGLPPGTMQHRITASATSSVSPKAPAIAGTLHDSDWDAGSLQGTPPPPKNFFPDTDEESEDRSRTGSIPISHSLLDPRQPPEPTLPVVPSSTAVQTTTFDTMVPWITTPKAKKEYRESAYYPYVGRRRYGKAKGTNKTSVKIQPVLAVHVARKPVHPTTPAAAQAQSSKKSTDISDLLTRATNKITDKLTRTAEQDKIQPISPARLHQSVTGVYLGWSEESKEDFDASKPTSAKLHYAAGVFTPRPTVKQTYSHIVTPARPLDERGNALAEQSDDRRIAASRKGSFLGGLLDMSREKGRERRREGIKKTIRLIPNAPAEGLKTRPLLEPKSASDSVVVPAVTEAPPARGIYGRRISGFGLV
ncbi:hypothetical protein AMS68_000942 [Peltaster fructicola]|uniref:Uncharacterized protein n=1 Tax=Peltaster fructicola TaxID=286661 RepID=A0A6H0XLC2_9PEZI|nr:hypothetical protein AMS68_000942 [Peltaster fructicola]